MKLLRLLAGFAVTAVLAIAPASVAISLPAAGDPNDFSFDSMHVTYELSLDENGRTVLESTETFVARFPDTDQNRGMQRAFPSRYDGHSTDIEFLGPVTDENGDQRPTEVEHTSDDDDGEFMVVTSRADDYLHGRQSYVFHAQQHNVTHIPDNSSTKIDEFYWDVNGTGWSQPFGEVTAELLVSPELAASLTGAAACYRGPQGSAVECDTLTFNPDAAADEPVLVASASGLGAFENLSIAVAFEPGTVVPKDSSLGASFFSWPAIVASIAALIAALGALALRIVAGRNHPGRGTIIAEYLPPRGVNVLLAGNVSGDSARARSALIVDLAVRHNIAILEGDKGEFFLELRGAQGLDAEELAAVRAFFAREYASGIPEGAVIAIKKVDPAAAKGIAAVDGAISLRVVDEGYRVRRQPKLRVPIIIVSALLGVLGVGFGVMMLMNEVAPLIPVLCIVAAAVGFCVAIFTAGPIKPLTARGAELHDYLEGLRLYINVAEKDRLAALQSPDGALRSPFRPDAAEDQGLLAAASAAQPLAVLKLYERLLPYAILFGQEKQWSKTLGKLYEEQGAQPDWWNSQNGFSVAVFAGSVGAFSSSAQVSWASSSGSSSSGGSGGGGFSGGGGGGGGGGGV